jgi:hypothetical protein
MRIAIPGGTHGAVRVAVSGATRPPTGANPAKDSAGPRHRGGWQRRLERAW